MHRDIALYEFTRYLYFTLFTFGKIFERKWSSANWDHSAHC